MDLSVKVKISIRRNLDSIVNKDFTESNIKELLIDIREFIPKFLILREVADFIAHPNRNRGMCHSEIDWIYFNLRRLHPSITSINVEKIPIKLYETVFNTGLKSINTNYFTIKTGMSKENFLFLLKNNYRQSGKYMILMNKSNFENTLKGINFMFSSSFTIKPVFSQQDFKIQLENAIKEIQELLNFEFNYLNALRENENDIILCVMALLHDAKIVLYDNSIGKLQLTILRSTINNITSEPYMALSAVMSFQREVLVNIQYCILKADIKINDYVDFVLTSDFKGLNLVEVTTKRINGSLKLVK